MAAKVLADEGLTVAELLAQGAKQVSAKYRRVARDPVGMTALEALQKLNPAEYARIMSFAEERAADSYRRLHAEDEGNLFSLSIEEFSEFRSRTRLAREDDKATPGASADTSSTPEKP